jgi:hypothetical protein
MALLPRRLGVDLATTGVAEETTEETKLTHILSSKHSIFCKTDNFEGWQS